MWKHPCFNSYLCSIYRLGASLSTLQTERASRYRHWHPAEDVRLRLPPFWIVSSWRQRLRHSNGRSLRKRFHSDGGDASRHSANVVRSDDNLIWVQPFCCQWIKKIGADGVEQFAGAGDQIGDGMRQRVYCVKLVVGDMDKLFFHLFGSVPVFRRADADGLGHGEMFIIQIRERTFVTDYTRMLRGSFSLRDISFFLQPAVRVTSPVININKGRRWSLWLFIFNILLAKI